MIENNVHTYDNKLDPKVVMLLDLYFLRSKVMVLNAILTLKLLTS